MHELYEIRTNNMHNITVCNFNNNFPVPSVPPTLPPTLSPPRSPTANTITLLLPPPHQIETGEL